MDYWSLIGGAVYNNETLEDALSRAFAFSDAGSSHMYWLAKSFIVLGDSYVDRENLAQAKATFESVRDGYQPTSSEDDVMDNVRMRLTKLDEIIAQKN